MSEENIETIRRAIDSWNRSGVDGVVELAHPDAVIYPFPEWPDDAVYRGKDGWRRLLTQFAQSFDDLKWVTDEVISKGENVVALVHAQAEIKGTGVPITQEFAGVWGDFRSDGKVGEGRLFLSWDEALEAAGLSE